GRRSGSLERVFDEALVDLGEAVDRVRDVAGVVVLALRDGVGGPPGLAVLGDVLPLLALGGDRVVEREAAGAQHLAGQVGERGQRLRRAVGQVFLERLPLALPDVPVEPGLGRSLGVAHGVGLPLVRTIQTLPGASSSPCRVWLARPRRGSTRYPR